MSAPSGYTALDFVGFTDKGTYNPLATYMRNDLVHYGGNIWKCLVDNTTGITPVEGANWTLWIGTSANLAERTIAPLLNNPADAAFGVGRQVIYDDWLWEVIAPIAIGDTLIDYAVDPTNANIKKSAPVETQLLAVKAEADATDNMIAPTETNASSSSAAYAVGDQLILNNILYDVIAAIQIGDALITGTGGNIAAADSLTEQLAAKANSSDLAAVATSGAYSDLSGTPTLATVATSGSYNDLSNKPTLGTAAAKDSTNAVTQNSTDLVESGAVYSEANSIRQALTNVTDDIAYTNTNSITASKNYQVGEQFFLDGILREAKTNISNGDTLTLDSNYKNANRIVIQLFGINSELGYKQNEQLYNSITINGTSRNAVESSLNLIANNLNQVDTSISESNFSAHVTSVGCIVVLNGQVSGLTAQSTTWQTVSTDATKIPVPAFSPYMIAGDKGRIRLKTSGNGISLDVNVDGANVTDVNFVLVYIKAV